MKHDFVSTYRPRPLESAMIYPNEGRPWVQTVSGRAVPLVDPEPDDIRWPDVLYALSHLNRFAGNTGGYSVAQHTLHPLRWLPESIQPYWLLHDAHEFVFGDMPRPARAAIEYEASRVAQSAGYTVANAIRAVKHGLDFAIYTAAGLEWPLSIEATKAIEEIDQRMLITEQQSLLGPQAADWGFTVEPFPLIESRYPPVIAYSLMRAWFRELLDIRVPEMRTVSLLGER
jgi:hypothetical protein